MTVAISTDQKFFCALAAINNAPFVDTRDLRSVDRRLLDVYRQTGSSVLRQRAGRLLRERGFVFPMPEMSGPGGGRAA